MKSSSFVYLSQKPLLLYNNLQISVERHQQEDDLDAGLHKEGTSINSDQKPKDEQKEIDGTAIVDDEMSDDDQSYDLSAISR